MYTHLYTQTFKNCMFYHIKILKIQFKLFLSIYQIQLKLF